MEIYKWNIETEHKWHQFRNVALALWLALGISNFSYSQENWSWSKNRIEQTNKSWDKNVDTYKIMVVNRNNNIVNNTSETLDEFVDRLQRQFNFEVGKNANIQQKINEIKSILNDKYSQNITNNDPFFIIQTALKTISNNDNKYIWLSEYSNNFSWKFDLNFVDALWYVQYMNDLSSNWIILWKNWENTLNRIINDLNIWWDEQLVQNIVTDEQNNEQDNSIFKQSIKTIEKHDIYKTTINNKENRINSDYLAKVENRNNNITNKTSETLDEFAMRVSKQFEYELKEENSLILKKIGDIEMLLMNKYNLKSNSDPIATIQSALIELSKTEKYKWLQEYTSKFSWNFDINFINAYWLVQYLNDWSCNWALHGKNWAFILQSIYDELNISNKTNSDITNNSNNNSNGQNPSQKDNINKQKIENSDYSLNDNSHNNTLSHDDEVNIEENDDVEQDNMIGPNEEKIENDEPTNIEMKWINLLSNNLSYDKLNWITYEDLWSTVDWFKHEWLRNAVMNYLLHNDVIWAQRLLWMDINCNKKLYPNYVASTKIWQRELDLMERLWESRRYMDTEEILNFMERVEKAYEIENYEVKTTYLKFLSWEFNNGWLPYCIISKYDYKMYLFSADHKLLSCQSVLTWAHIWNHPNDPKWWYHTTPGWMYEVWWFFDKSSEWKNLVSVYGTDYILFLPLEHQYVYSDEYTMGMHGYTKWRGNRLTSQHTIDHRVSNWCVNLDRATFWEVFNHLKKGSKIYICRDDE